MMLPINISVEDFLLCCILKSGSENEGRKEDPWASETSHFAESVRKTLRGYPNGFRGASDEHQESNRTIHHMEVTSGNHTH